MYGETLKMTMPDGSIVEVQVTARSREVVDEAVSRIKAEAFELDVKIS